MPHDHAHHHAHDHNFASADHLHSHPHADGAAEDLQTLAAQFIDGFAAAADKTAFLRLARIPFEIADGQGGPSLKLVDVKLTTEWQVATASPGFGSRELSHLPFPGAMVRERANMGFVYVSMDRREVVDLKALLAALAEG
ncbi:MAG: hypothetical protein ACFCUS_13245 [Rubrimonas sp.]|uniref:hypothetical protein n=1 Tax=Rubrimonas sp. TaxID=2036015 RepID=UPI002FDE6504